MVDSSAFLLQLADLQQQAAHHFASKNYDEAAAIYEHLAEVDPDSRSAYWHLGLIRLLQGQESDAQMIWMVAIAEGTPEQVDMWTGELLHVLEHEAAQREQANDDELAWAIRQHIREIAPDDASNLLHLVRLSLKLKTFSDDELANLGLLSLLQTRPAAIDPNLLFQVLEELLDQALLQPQVADLAEACFPYANNSQAFIDLLLAKAIKLHELSYNRGLAYRYANLCLKLNDDRRDVLYQLCCICQDDRRYAEGIALARRYYATCQTVPEKVIGNALLLRGLMNTGTQWTEATAVLQQQTELFHAFLSQPAPSSDELPSVGLLGTPLFFYPYLSDNAKENRSLQNQVAQFYQSGLNAYLEQHVTDYQPYPKAPLVRPADRKILRIGYLSRFLYRHSIGWLSRWLFEHFDRDRFEVYAYFIQPTEMDELSKGWFAAKATCACTFDGDALGIAKAIQADEIDILVDLDSLTSVQCCSVLALKPAPIQVTWLGLDATGLPSIDYFLADPYVLPDNAQDYYTEQIWRLPQTYVGVDGFEISTPTLQRNLLNIPADAVTYLSAQFAYKRHPHMVRLQMQILKQVPNSYFLIKGLSDEEGMRALFEQEAAKVGVERDRLRFLPRDPDEETHRANLAIADIVLDTFPYNGATTTLETLWLGIPMVTRVGQQFAARNSYTMMINAGVTEGIAWTDDEYIEWGVRFGIDAALRKQVFTKLRRSRQTSPLWNGKQFTRDLEHAYQQMWERYLQQHLTKCASELIIT